MVAPPAPLAQALLHHSSEAVAGAHLALLLLLLAQVPAAAVASAKLLPAQRLLLLLRLLGRQVALLLAQPPWLAGLPLLLAPLALLPPAPALRLLVARQSQAALLHLLLGLRLLAPVGHWARRRPSQPRAAAAAAAAALFVDVASVHSSWMAVLQ